MIDYSVANKEESAKKRLACYAGGNWKIFIDTSSMLHFAADQFWDNLIPFLRMHNNKVYIPLSCAEELKKFADNPNPANPDHQRAEHCLRRLKRLKSEGLVEFRAEPDDGFSDHVFLKVFTKFKTKYKLLLITQDVSLAEDIFKRNDFKSVRGYPVNVSKINQYGLLSGFMFAADINRTVCNESHPGAELNSEGTVDEAEVFEMGKTVTSIEDTKCNVRHIPGENEAVCLQDGGEILLGSEIGFGGEGKIYDVRIGTENIKYVAKIYGKGSITRRKLAKIKLMLGKPFKCEGVCYPAAALYNRYNEFVGCLMPKAEGVKLKTSVCLPAALKKRFPDWKKRDAVELCVTILNKIKYLHDRHIIMGDINPSNILVVSPKEVYFVDTDSYQIEGFPCPVGTTEFTAPEIQGNDYKSFLRTMGNENFAVATLLFMIMLPGKNPYAQQGGEDLISNIINMDFSYPCGDNSNKKTPDGPWRFMWSHLPRGLKEAFYETFRKDGKHSTESTRLTAADWLGLFNYYLWLLDSGKYGEQDRMSEELFPTRHKKDPKKKYAVCKLCGFDMEEQYLRDGYCQPCLQKPFKVCACAGCGSDIVYTYKHKLIDNAEPHKYCADCNKERNQIVHSLICACCSQPFNIVKSECEYYHAHGLELPKRCKKCRKTNSC